MIPASKPCQFNLRAQLNKRREISQRHLELVFLEVSRSSHEKGSSIITLQLMKCMACTNKIDEVRLLIRDPGQKN